MSRVLQGWQDVQDEVLRRIHAREWPPGALIPNEADLAREFGCARATVNRALRSVAEAGLLDRRRKAGTRVAQHPAAKATLTIPLIRQEIEEKGNAHGYRLLIRDRAKPPPEVARKMRLAPGAEALHLRALHLADGAPYAIEDRWINLAVVPDAGDAPFETVSGNEWLLQHAPFTHGEIGFSAEMASDADSGDLVCGRAAALFVIDRLTFDGDAAITCARLSYAPGHRMQAAV